MTTFQCRRKHTLQNLVWAYWISYVGKDPVHIMISPDPLLLKVMHCKLEEYGCIWWVGTCETHWKCWAMNSRMIKVIDVNKRSLINMVTYSLPRGRILVQIRMNWRFIISYFFVHFHFSVFDFFHFYFVSLSPSMILPWLHILSSLARAQFNSINMPFPESEWENSLWSTSGLDKLWRAFSCSRGAHRHGRASLTEIRAW